MDALQEALKEKIREVKDFPIRGINFKDLSPIFLYPGLVEACQQVLASHWTDMGVTKVIGIDSRGFLLGPQMAINLQAGFVMVRKEGKLPPETVSVQYQLEYGEATLEAGIGAIIPSDRVVIHDDLLATGGTAAAAAKLVQAQGAKILGFSFLGQLLYLNGVERLRPYSNNIQALIDFEK